MMEVWSYYYAYGGDPIAAGLVDQPKRHADAKASNDTAPAEAAVKGPSRYTSQRQEPAKRFWTLHNQPRGCDRPQFSLPGL